MTEPRITMAHVKRLRSNRRTCTPGIRKWCEVNRVDIRDFVANGIAGEEALRIGDAFSLQLLKIARSEGGDDGRR